MHEYRTAELQETGLLNQLSAQQPNTASLMVTTTRNETLNIESCQYSNYPAGFTTDLRKQSPRWNRNTRGEDIGKWAARGVTRVWHKPQSTDNATLGEFGPGCGCARKEAGVPTDNSTKHAYCYHQPSSTLATRIPLPRNQLLQAWAVTGRYAAIQLWRGSALCWTPCNSFTRSDLLYEPHSKVRCSCDTSKWWGLYRPVVTAIGTGAQRVSLYTSNKVREILIYQTPNVISIKELSEFRKRYFTH